jgi:hypothetical protein
MLLATLCAALSIALFALGGADTIGGFCLQTLSFGRPTVIMRPIWDTIVVPHVVIAGKMCKKSRRRVNMGLLRLVRVCRFTSSVVTPWGHKRIWFPLRIRTSSCTIYRSLLTSFPTPKKRERKKEGKEKRGTPKI